MAKLLADNIINTPRNAEDFDDVIPTQTLGELPTKKEIQQQMMKFLGIVRHTGNIHSIIEWFEKYSPV